MKILAIDCSATAASCAVCEGGKILASSYVNVKLTHSQTLLPMVQNVLSSAMLTLQDIDAFAVNTGPGSFTGVRIGISAVKGLALPDRKPCVAVSTLQSIAENCLSVDCVVCAVMDARCNQVYNALFRVKGGKIEQLCDDRAVMVREVEKELLTFKDETVIIAGDGTRLFEGFAEQNDLRIAKEPMRFQNACGTARAAEELLQTKGGIDPEALTPFYLRLPQAERELKAKEKKS